MGVTKQAAQKRFAPKADLDPSQGFHRFSGPARNAVVSSMNAARAAGNPEIAPAHLVLGLLAMAVIKATLVGMYFMHLKFEGLWIYMMLIPVFILATVVVTGLMPDMVLNENADPGPPAVASPAGPGTA